MNTVAPTTNTELLPLLLKLAALAPEVCRYEQDQRNHYRFKLDALNYTIDLVDGQDVSPLDYAAVQCAVQGAVCDCGWVIDCESYQHADTQEYRWDVFVYDKARLVVDGDSFRCDDKNPAIALLSAFVAALEAA